MYEAYVSNEVAFKLPVEIQGLAYHKSTQRILGLSKTDLLVYAYNKGGRKGYVLDGVNKRVSRNAVQSFRMVGSGEYILCHSAQILYLHSSSPPFPVKVVVKIQPVYAYTSHYDEKTNVIHIAVVTKKRIIILRLENDEFFETPSDIPFVSDANTVIAWGGSCLAFAMRDNYTLLYLKYNAEKKSFSEVGRHLLSVGEIPIILDLPDRDALAFARGDTITLCPSTFDSANQQQIIDVIKFSEAITAFEYDSPYLVALLPRGRVEIRSIRPSMLIQSVVLNKAFMLTAALPGMVCVGSSYDIWMLDAHPNLRKNVSTLVSEKYFSLAIQLTENSELFSPDFRADIKRQAALNLFHQRKFEEAFQLHLQIKSSVVSVLQLFPDLLPSTLQSKELSEFDLTESERRRATLALGDYLSAVRALLSHDLDKHNKAKMGKPDGKLMSKEDKEKTHTELQFVDTTLLQCYIRTKPLLIDSLLRIQDSALAFEDAESMLIAENRPKSLFVLYETRRKHEKALRLLRTQASLPNPDPFFQGVHQTVEYLQQFGVSIETKLLFEYAKWVLAEDPEEGLSIFTSDESGVAKSLDREVVLHFLEEECVSAMIPYLEHVIFDCEESRPQLHEALLEQYVAKVKQLLSDYIHAFKDDENVLRAGKEEGELGVYRRKLLKFLEQSLSYTPSTILVQLNQFAFSEERALIFGRMKKHDQALSIYTGILHDYEGAEKYCNLYYNPHDPIDSQVYLILMRSFVSPTDPQLSGLVERELPVPASNVPQAIKVLARYADRMDPVSALSLIPSGVPLSDLSHALSSLVQSISDQSTSTSVRRSMCESGRRKANRRLRQVTSQSLLLNNNSQCAYCEKTIGVCVFVRLPSSGCLVHTACYDSHKDRDRMA